MIKNIRKGGKTPKDIYRVVNGQPKKIKRIYRIANGQPVIVWDVGEIEEYIEIPAYFQNKEYLQQLSTQYISIQFINYCYYDDSGNLQTQNILTPEWNSFECSTLTPTVVTTTWNGVQVTFTANYKLEFNSLAIEHLLKVTYKSPKTGKILEASTSAFYFAETGFNYGSDTLDWYPFRQNFYDGVKGESKLEFECTDKQGGTLTTYSHYSRSGANINYILPALDNAAYKIADNQTLTYNFISPNTLRTYSGTLIFNVRRFDDERNIEKIDGTYGNNFVKDFKYFNLKIQTECDYYTEISPGPAGWSTNPDPNERNIENIRRAAQYSPITHHNNSFEMWAIHSGFTYTGNYRDSSYLQFPASVGFVYWGDGTISDYQAGYYYYNQSESNQVAAVDYTVQNGYQIIDGERVPVYMHLYPQNGNTHNYLINKVYDITITSAFPNTCYSTVNNATTTNFVYQGYNFNTWSAANANIMGGDVTEYTPYKDFVMPLTPQAVQVLEMEIGEGCLWGPFYYIRNGYTGYSSNGYFGRYNAADSGGVLNTHSMDMRYLVAMRSLTLPRFFLQSQPGAFFSDAKSLSDIYYGGTVAEFEDYAFNYQNSFGDGLDNSFFARVGDNATFRSGDNPATYALNVHCLDGDITVTVN